MKKLVCFLLCIFLLCGCENKKEVENHIPDFYGFKSRVNTIINDVKISADVEYESFDKLVLTFLLPENIKNMRIELVNGDYIIEYDDLAFTISKENIPYNSICNIIMNCAENIKLATNNNGVYTFASKGQIYNVEIDMDTKSFKKVEVDKTCVIEFENFEYVMGHTE